MKKLIVLAATAAMATLGNGASCYDVAEAAVCRAWDVKMTLKTLAPKKTSCSVAARSVCEDSTEGVTYYMDDAKRTLKGYLWICDYTCDDEPVFNCVLWDAKNRRSVIAYSAKDVQTVSASEVYAYGKKADKIAGTIEFTGTDAAGDEAIYMTATGIKGKFKRGATSEDGYIKSLSGHACGTLKYVGADSTVVYSASTLCSDGEVVEECPCEEARLIPFCEACCFENWCDAEYAPEMVPAVGTWSMKYNKKVSTGSKSMGELIPLYAL